MILADTSVWIDTLANSDGEQVDKLNAAIASDQILVGDLIMLEVLQGIRKERDVLQVIQLFRQIRNVSLCDPQLALLAASNYRQLRRVGITVRSTIDVVIATWCIENDIALLHKDRDYTPMETHLGLIAA